MKKKLFPNKYSRLYRGALAFGSILLSRVTGNNRPVLMYIHLTNRCNLRCKYCYANVEDRFNDPKIKDFSTELWKKLIDESWKIGARYFHLYGGEPLLRDDISELIEYCKNKGGFVEILTNGHLIGTKIAQIQGVDSVCLSLDGDQEANDANRGKGNFLAVKEAVRICKEYGIPSRIHAVINHFNLKDPEYLPKLGKEWGVTVSYSQPHIFDYINEKSIVLSDEEIRGFWKKINELKHKGYPIDNTYNALDYAINWPISYQHIIKTKKEALQLEKEKKFTFLNCEMGKGAVVVYSQGSLLPCLNFGMFSDHKFHEVGFEKAYEMLCAKECYACANLQFVEVNLALRLNPFSVLKGVVHHLWSR